MCGNFFGCDVQKWHGISVPLQSDCFDSFKISYRIRMSAKVKAAGAPYHPASGITEGIEQRQRVPPQSDESHLCPPSQSYYTGTAFSDQKSQYRCRSPGRNPPGGRANRNICHSWFSRLFFFYYTHRAGQYQMCKFIQ